MNTISILRTLVCLSALSISGCAADNPGAIQKMPPAANNPVTRAPYAPDAAAQGFLPLPQRQEAPIVKTESSQTVTEIATCLQNQLRHTFNMPEEFFRIDRYVDRSVSVVLFNPVTHQEGLSVDVRPTGVNQREIALYAHNREVSKVWRQLPQRCR